jgi:hypothetical protein
MQMTQSEYEKLQNKKKKLVEQLAELITLRRHCSKQEESRIQNQLTQKKNKIEEINSRISELHACSDGITHLSYDYSKTSSQSVESIKKRR